MSKPDSRNKRWIGSELLDIFVDGEERQTVDQNIDKIVVIDTSPIGTIDFRLTSQEKEFLLQVGKAAALKFLFQRKLDDGPHQEEAGRAQSQAEASRKLVCQMRLRKRSLRIAGSLALFFLIVLIYIGWKLIG